MGEGTTTAAATAQSCSAQENKVTKKVTKGSQLDLGPASRTLLKLPPTSPFLPFPQLPTLCLISGSLLRQGLSE